MAENAEKLGELEAELSSCLGSNEFLDALDICEEIEALGEMQGRHWLAMAQCLMGLRRKADAKHAWLEVIKLNPEEQEALDGLNRHFPGWRREAAKPAPAPSAPPSRPRPQPARRPPGGDELEVTRPSAPASGSPRAAVPQRRAANLRPVETAAPAEDSPVNWNYILEDFNDAISSESIA